MVTVTNDCCNCEVPGFPCIGSRCELLHAPHFFCDECGDEVHKGELYWYNNRQLCADCVTNEVLEELEVVTYE